MEKIRIGYPGWRNTASFEEKQKPGTNCGNTCAEHNLAAPLLSISLGLSAIFLLGGPQLDQEPVPYLLARQGNLKFGAQLSANARFFASKE
jgi:hypothetical protein